MRIDLYVKQPTKSQKIPVWCGGQELLKEAIKEYWRPQGRFGKRWYHTHHSAFPCSLYLYLDGGNSVCEKDQWWLVALTGVLFPSPGSGYGSFQVSELLGANIAIWMWNSWSQHYKIWCFQFEVPRTTDLVVRKSFLRVGLNFPLLTSSDCSSLYFNRVICCITFLRREAR